MANGKKWYDTTLGKIGIGFTTGGIGLGVRHFAKKYSEANKGINQQVSALQNMNIPQEQQQAYEQAKARENVGISAPALGLYNKQTERNIASAMGQLQSKRSALAGIGDIVGASQDAALKLAGMDEEQRQRNMEIARGLGLDLGQAKLGLQQYKQEGLFNYWMGKKQALNRTVSGIATGVARIGAAALTGGASEAAGIGSAITAAGQGGGAQPSSANNWGLKGLPSSSTVPKFKF